MANFEIREEVVKKLVEMGWTEGNARLSERANHSCEYCGLSFFDSPENYYQWSRDHIVPLSKRRDEENFDNLAVACKTCNVNFKLRWDPRKKAGENTSRDQLRAYPKTVAVRKVMNAQARCNIPR
jgi:5-methylcytosine-specific restriction endonuclease McrA